MEISHRTRRANDCANIKSMKWEIRSPFFPLPPPVGRVAFVPCSGIKSTWATWLVDVGQPFRFGFVCRSADWITCNPTGRRMVRPPLPLSWSLLLHPPSYVYSSIAAVGIENSNRILSRQCHGWITSLYCLCRTSRPGESSQGQAGLQYSQHCQRPSTVEFISVFSAFPSSLEWDRESGCTFYTCLMQTPGRGFPDKTHAVEERSVR